MIDRTRPCHAPDTGSPAVLMVNLGHHPGEGRSFPLAWCAARAADRRRCDRLPAVDVAVTAMLALVLALLPIGGAVASRWSPTVPVEAGSTLVAEIDLAPLASRPAPPGPEEVTTVAGMDLQGHTVTWTCVGCLLPDSPARAIGLLEDVKVGEGVTPSWALFADFGN